MKLKNRAFATVVECQAARVGANQNIIITGAYSAAIHAKPAPGSSGCAASTAGISPRRRLLAPIIAPRQAR